MKYSRQSTIQSLLGSLDAEQFICVSRAFIALFIVAASYFEPTNLLTGGEGIRITLALYSAYAVLLAIFSFTSFISEVPQIIAQGVDILLCFLLMAFTSGATSPYFVLLIFSQLAAALRWGGPGTAFASAIVIILYFAFAYVGVPGQGAEQGGASYLPFLFGGFLFVTGILATFASATMGWNRDRLRSLWAELTPSASEPQRYGALTQVMQNAVKLSGGCSVLAVWNTQGESELSIASYVKDYKIQRLERKIPITSPPDLNEWDAWYARDPYGFEVHHRTITLKVSVPLMAPWLKEAFSFNSFVCAPFRTDRVRGYFLVLDPPVVSDSTFALTEITAARVANELEHLRNLGEFEQIAIWSERTRISRDLHDGILQNLAAVNLQLHKIARSAPEEIALDLRSMIAELKYQQAMIRAMLQSENPKPAKEPRIALDTELSVFARRIGDLWGCGVSVEVGQAPADISPALALQLFLIISEATANAVRHGSARNLLVEVWAEEELLVVQMRDDGGGRSKETGEEATPYYLTQRVTELGGTVSNIGEQTGVALRVRVPIQ